MTIKCHEFSGAESILGERGKRGVATISTVWLIIALGRVVYQLAPAYFHPQGSHFTAPVWGPWDLLLLTPLIVIGLILAGISLWAELGGGTCDSDANRSGLVDRCSDEELNQVVKMRQTQH